MVSASAGKKYRSCIFGSRNGTTSTENAASVTSRSGVSAARLRFTRIPTAATARTVNAAPTGQ